MLAGILFFTRSQAATDPPAQWRYAILGATAMGSAISIKLIPLLLLPICAFALGRRAWALGLSLAIPAALSLPFGFPQVPIWQSLGRFIYVTRLNDIFWWIVEETVWPNPHQKNYHYNVIIIVAVLVVSVFSSSAIGARFALGDGHGARFESRFAPVVLHMDSAPRGLAEGRCLAGAFGNDFRLLPLLWDERLFLLPWHSEPWLRGFIFIPPIVAASLRTAAQIFA